MPIPPSSSKQENLENLAFLGRNTSPSSKLGKAKIRANFRKKYCQGEIEICLSFAVFSFNRKIFYAIPFSLINFIS